MRRSLVIDCKVSQNGWRTASLREILKNKCLLLPNKGLDFTTTDCSVSYPYDVKWKVLNRGDEAEHRNKIRGEIISPNRAGNARHERTSFRGEHVAECYIIKDGIVVARDVIDVPISTHTAGVTTPTATAAVSRLNRAPSVTHQPSSYLTATPRRSPFWLVISTSQSVARLPTSRSRLPFVATSARTP
ncbi:nucleotide-binding domain-containing protein [Amycolatopsis balhimycina]|uniref:nucleotide-binding domain-containing protein n=1 Tax=Amycolatopsis balhimycina TaxID=208443 RepID=UPI00146AB549